MSRVSGFWLPYFGGDNQTGDPLEYNPPQQSQKRRKVRRKRMAAATSSTARAATTEEKQKWAAEAEAAQAEAELHKAETREKLARAQEAEISLRSKKRQEQDELAKDSHHYVYVFDDAVREESVKKCINQLNQWTRQKKACKIEIQINSPGGSVIDGFALIDYITDLRAKGHTIDIVALGVAASMAGVLLQSATKRIIGQNAFLLIHEAQFGAIGTFGKIEDQVKFVELMHDKILTLFASRATPINPKTTKALIKRKWSRKDWWMNAEDALKFGFVDEVR